MKQILIIVVAALILWFGFLKKDEVYLGSGVFAPDSPEQVNIDSGESFSVEGYSVTPLASFSIKAKVLSRKNYRYGRETDLSPMDLALGWGRMSDEQVLDSIKIWQSGRWYRWRTDHFPIPRREIETHSANMHLIPADKVVFSAMKRALKGNVVEFSGYLVKVKASDGWRWGSSMNRTDTGGHACELVWVDQFLVCEE